MNCSAHRPDGKGPTYRPGPAWTSRLRTKCGNASSQSTCTNHGRFHASIVAYRCGQTARANSRNAQSVSKWLSVSVHSTVRVMCLRSARRRGRSVSLSARRVRRRARRSPAVIIVMGLSVASASSSTPRLAGMWPNASSARGGVTSHRSSNMEAHSAMVSAPLGGRGGLPDAAPYIHMPVIRPS